MKFVKTLSRFVRRDTVSGMQLSDAGMYGLPIEIWEHIFSLATASVVPMVDLKHELQTNIPSSSLPSYHSRSILTDFYQTQNPNIFHLRRSIVLVCKSWYFMGIKALHSHIRLCLLYPPEVLRNFRRGLDKNPRLSSSVIRVSISTGEYGEGFFNAHKKIIRQILSQILSRLSRLKIVTFPHFYSNLVQMHQHPEVSIIYSSLGTASYWVYHPISNSHYFWHHSQTLVFETVEEPWKMCKSGKLMPIVFPNLVNLSLYIERISTRDWITEYWDAPNLRSLTIESPAGISSSWLQVIAKFANSVEYLGLANDGRFSEDSGPLSTSRPIIVLPKLRSLDFIRPVLYRTGYLQPVLDYLRAPNLERFGIDATQDRSTYGTSYVSEKIDTALKVFPRVKVITLYYGNHISLGRWLGLDSTKWKKKGLIVENRELITREDIHWESKLRNRRL